MADSLATLRRKIAELATDDENDTSDDGDFYVACAETDESPEPLANKRFLTKDAAEAAADLARSYRDVLRENDSELPERRLSVYEVSDQSLTMVSTRKPTDGTRANGLPRTSRSVTLSGDGEREWLRMDNAPIVHVRRDGEPLPDDAIERQLDSKL